MKNLPLLIGTLILTSVLIGGVALLFSNSGSTKTVNQAQVVGDARHVQGPDTAKVTVVEFGDFQCPACKATEPIVQQLLTTHGKEIRFIFRQFPLTQVHPNAQRSAQVAEATTSFGKFWQMHDLLYETQDDWGDLKANEAQAKFDSYVEKLKIDKNEFKKKIDSQETNDKITTDVSDATKINVDGTPTFYVNGQKTLAPQLISTVESFLTKTQ